MNITTCVRCCDRRSFNGRIVYMGSQTYVWCCVTTVGSKNGIVTDLIKKRKKLTIIQKLAFFLYKLNQWGACGLINLKWGGGGVGRLGDSYRTKKCVSNKLRSSAESNTFRI